ncbi:hypothetical protein ACQ7HM_07385 [Williamsia sp. MIQD14]|uniref:hypothetical protein n=1 Tax=Williamsia sp. MIQD14 TaxID=3425703 RepID=UPI003DA03F61
MTLAVILVPVLFIAFVAVYRNQRDTAHLDRVPFSSGPDAARIHAELRMLTGRNPVAAQSGTKSSNAAANSRTQTARM